MTPSQENIFAIIQQLVGKGHKIFTLHEVKEALYTEGFGAKNISKNTSAWLTKLCKVNRIVRLISGFFAISEEAGGVPLHDFEIAMVLVRPCAISHGTALHYYDPSFQEPSTVFAITPIKTAVPRSLRGGKYYFIRISESNYFGIETITIDSSRIQITDMERTLLDGLKSPNYYGGFQTVLQAFKRNYPRIQLQRIIQYAIKLSPPIAKRLGWLLEYQLGIEERELEELLRVPMKGYAALDPSGLFKGRYNRKWRIIENMEFSRRVPKKPAIKPVS